MKMNTRLNAWVLRSMAFAIMASPLLTSAQTLLTPGWAGGSNTDGAAPPDPHGAAGPSGIIGTYNTSITYYSKSGNNIWGPINMATFFGTTGACLSDPKVLYDPASQRFFVIYQENTASQSFLTFAASTSSDPRTGTAADWNIYQQEETKLVNGVPNGIDYPGFAIDSQAVYVSYNMFQLQPGCNLGSGSGSRVVILNKAAMVAGTTVGTSRLDVGDQDLQPATPVGTSTPGNRVYLIEGYNKTRLKLWAIDDPLGAGTVNSTLITIPDNGGGGAGNGGKQFAPQFGSTAVVDALDTRAQAAVYQAGNIWVTLTAGPAGGPSKVYYYRVNPNGYPSGTPTLAESGTLGESGYWNFQPAIGANSAGDLAVVYTRCSSSTYPTMMYVYRSAADGSFGSPQLVKASGGPSVTAGSRWGDFAAVAADPIDGTLWITHEYARTGGANDWGTWFAQIGTPAYDLYVNLVSPCIVGSGTIAFPYCRLGQAVDAATHGTIHIAGGHYNEPITIKKAVTLTSWLNNGNVVIGAP